LVADEEEIGATYHDRIRILRSTGPLPPPSWLRSFEAYVWAADVGATLRLLQKLVPSYRPSQFLSSQVEADERPITHVSTDRETAMLLEKTA
jgi:hypothetical protein